ncbi:MAG: TonB-dependent receptor [Symploca sp. SIO2B6]|nr:TonB-dependent receptor [Symploca sp. SIO2B6]
MNKLYLLGSLGVASAVWSVACQSVYAETVRSYSKESSSEKVRTETPALSEMEHPATSVAEWLSQVSEADSPAVTQIIDVQLNATETGLTIVLNPSEGSLSPASTSVVGNALIADIPDATLALPDTDEFQSVNPTDEIAFVTVSNLPNNTVRVAITGVEAAPTAEVISEATGLVFNVSLEEGAIATEQTEDDTLQIVVTAQRTEEDLQDVPISITVLTEEQIEDAGITTLDDISQRTPNFAVFSATGNRFFNFYSIRGLPNVNFASRDTVGFFVDDVPYDYGGFITQDFTDLERVEILRGPQNTLYGRSSQAGVVNIITRRPTNAFEFDGTAGYGAFNDLDLRASVSGPIIQDQLFYRLSGNYGSRDGYVDNNFLDDDLDDQSGGNGRGKLLWTPSDDWEILLNASFDDYRDGGGPLLPIDDEPFEIEQDVNGFTDLVSNAQSLRIAYEPANLRVTSITSRRFSSQDIETDLDFSTVRSGTFTNIFDSTVITQELRIQSPEEAERFQWLAGGYYESRTFNTEDDGFNFGPDAALLFGDFAVPGASLLRNADLDTTVWAGFGQVSYQPIEDLTLTAGLRYESVSNKLDSFERVLTLPDGSETTFTEFNDVEQDGDILLPRFAVEYRFNPEVVAYGTIARGYRPGGINFRPDNEFSLTFESERSLNYEIGLKSSLLDDRLGVNLAAFHNPIEDYQVLILDPFTAVPLEITNADAALTGVELELRATPSEGLDIIAGVGYVDARFTDFRDRVTGEVFDGNQLPFAPEWTYNLAVQYRAPMGLFARAELTGFGDTFFDEANTFRQSAFTIFNARLGYEFGNYGLYVFGNNIFDLEYLTNAAGTVGVQSGQYGVPATFGVQFRAKL